MSHSVFFFGVPNSQVTWNALDMLDKANAWLDLSPSSVSKKELSDMKRLVSEILTAKSLDECHAECFGAMLVIAKSNFEEIMFPTFTDYRDESFPEHVGIILPGSRFPPPFPVPRMRQNYPRTGFVPLQHLWEFQFEPGGLVDGNELKSLEDDLGGLLMDLGLGDAASMKGRLTGSFDEDFLEETRDDLAFTFEKLSDENKSLFFMAT